MVGETDLIGKHSRATWSRAEASSLDREHLVGLGCKFWWKAAMVTQNWILEAGWLRYCLIWEVWTLSSF